MTQQRQHATVSASSHYWSRRLSRRERIALRLTWPYWRQTRLIEPVWSWWVNRGA